MDGIINGCGEETDHRRRAHDSPRVFLRERNDWRVCLAYGGMSHLSHGVSNSVKFLKQCANSQTRRRGKKVCLPWGATG